MQRTTTGWAVALVCAAGFVSGCGDESAPASNELRVDTFNVGLAGAFVPNEAARRPAVIAAMANLPSDVVCLQEVWTQEDKDAVGASARARFPHQYSVRHNLETAVTHDIDPGCMVPPEATTAPCAADPGIQMTFEAGVACIARSCSTMPGSEMGRTTSTACAQTNCFSSVAGLLTGVGPAMQAGLRCYGCFVPNLPTETLASIRSTCTTNARGGLAFGGQSGTMILSRYPLTDTETLVIPGTWNRRVITRATVNLPSGARVGVYCNHLTPVFEGTAFPYTGRYGCGDVGRDGWIREQRAQAERLVAEVRRREGTTGRAVILGDFNAGPRNAAGQPELTDEAGETFSYLSQQFTLAAPSGFVPRCTYCPDNANNPDAEPTWIDHVFLHNFAAGATRSTERTFTEATVTVPGQAARVPLSDHYGVRVVLTAP